MMKYINKMYKNSKFKNSNDEIKNEQWHFLMKNAQFVGILQLH